MIYASWFLSTKMAMNRDLSNGCVGEIQIGCRRPTGGETLGGFLYLARNVLNDSLQFILDANFHYSKNLETGVQL